MKYYYEKPPEWIGAGEIYICDHPLYNRCTLFCKGSKGLAVVQERFDNKRKTRWWGPVEPWIAADIYFNKDFDEYFNKNAAEANKNGLYPTVSIRKIMWALRMKPLRKEYWENSGF